MTTQRQQVQATYRTALDDIEISADVESAIAQMQASGKDTGSLTAQQRAGYVTALCRALRLNPLTNPVQFIRLNGKEVLYVTRTATDQLAAIHGLNRRTVRGPEIVDIAGTKIAICAVEVTLPNGRSETATATLPVADPAMLYMKLETKAKRRGTLAILGLGLLAEEEAESIPGAERGDLTPSQHERARDAVSYLGADNPTLGEFNTAAREAALADEPQGSRAWAEFVAEIAEAESCVAAHCLYVALVAAEGETYTREAGDMAEARLRALGYALDRAEVNAVLAATGQPLARWIDAADDALFGTMGADAVLVAARWWVAQRERIGAALSKPAATMVYMALARSLRSTPDAAGTTRAKKALNAAVEALAPKPPPTGTDSPTSARGDTATSDATPADATPSAEALASIARVGDPLAYLATKHTFTEVERAVVAHGAHVPALAAAAIARLEALGEGGDESNRARLVAAWVSESASRAQRAERTAAKVQRAA